MEANIAEIGFFAMRHLPAFFLVFSLLALPVLAQDAMPIYDVSGIAIDVTSDNAAQARDKAIIQAQRDAFTQLLTKMGAASAAAKASDNDIAAMVKSFEVQDERASAVRYIATFAVHFRPSTVRDYLDKRSVSYSETGDQPAPENPAKPDEETSREPAMEMDVDVPVAGIADWGQIKHKLETVPSLSSINVVTMQRGLAQIEINYRGDVEELQAALQKQGLKLQPDTSGAWILKKDQP